MTRKAYKLKDLVENATDASLWERGSFKCVSCRKSAHKQYKFTTTLGAVCVNCVETELKKSVRTVALKDWPLEKVQQVLTPEIDMNIRDRLTVLWRSHEIIQNHDAKKLKEFKKLLIRNMGFVVEHPLAQPVRQAASRACISIGKSMTPLLIELCAQKPWQLYANIIMVLGTIAPKNPDAYKLIEEAALDDNPEIRMRAQAVVLKIKHPESQVPPQDSPPKNTKTQEQIQLLMDSLDPSVRKFVRVGTEPPSRDAKSAPPKSHPPTALEGKMADLVNKHYTNEALKRLYVTYLHDHLFSASDFRVRGGFSISKVKKTDLVGIFARVFASKDLFLSFFYKLPKDTQEVFQTLVWEGGEREAKELEKRYKVEIVQTGRKYGYGNTQDLHTPYAIFQARSQYDWRSYRDYSYSFFLSIDDALRSYFKGYLPAPKGYDLHSSSRDKTDFLCEDNDEILANIKLYGTYIEQGNLSFSKSTGKLLKRSLTQMVKYCHIQEFYEGIDRDLDFLKTRLAVDFLLGRKLKLEQEPLELLRSVFQEFFLKASGKGQKKLYDFLYHLKGGSYYEYDYEKRELQVKKALLCLLKALTPSEWYSLDMLLKYCFYREMNLDVVQAGRYGSELYFSQAYGKNYGGYERVYIRRDNYKEVLIAPFLKTMFFLFASFGLVDIAYDVPKNPTHQERDKAYLSPFDALRYVRLTPLGAYAIGLQGTYETSIHEENANVLLDEKRLILTIEGQDPLKQMILEKMADKLSNTCYKVTYQSFLKECANKKDIAQKIKIFRQLVSETPPPVWQDFLQDVQSKINPLTRRQTMSVFSLPENKELIALFARDEVLKKHVFKAEGFHILIEQKNISKVKKRLEEFGYFIDNI